MSGDIPIKSWSDPITWSNSPDRTILLLGRHGETFGNNQKNDDEYLYTGSGTNFPLNTEGEVQANALAETLCKLHEKGLIQFRNTIYSSPKTRALETAAKVASRLHCKIGVISHLNEIYWGKEMEGQRVKDVKAKFSAQETALKKQFPDRRERWKHLPIPNDAEKYSALAQRTISTLSAIGEFSKGHTVYLSSHGRFTKTLLAELLNKEENEVPYPNNCGIVVIEYAKGQLRLLEIRNISAQIPSKL
jgi:broad specificity phosphatase PhoE